MARFLHAIILGLVGAGIIHIAVLLMVPAYSQRDAWSALSELSNYNNVTRLDRPGAEPVIGSIDPLFNVVACRFDLSDGVVRLLGGGKIPYWSMSVYNRAGQNIFSVNDSSTSGSSFDFVIATPAQMIELRNTMPADFDRSIFVEADIDEGIVVVRAFTPDESWEETIATYLAGLACTSQE